MEKNRISRTLLIIVIVIILLIFAFFLCRGCSGTTDSTSTDVSPTENDSTEAAPTETPSLGISDIVGSWEGYSPVLGEISIIIEKTAPVLDVDETSNYVSGYIVFGTDPSNDPVAPLSGIASTVGGGIYEVQIWSTNLQPAIETPEIEDVQTSLILFTGKMDAEKGQVEGKWQSEDESEIWQMEHRSEAVPTSPVFDLEHSGLSINSDVMASVHTTGQNSDIGTQSIQFEVRTNITVSKVVVLTPDGTEIMVDQFTDIFSPGVDFINEFRFGTGFEGVLVEGEYVFNFLDPMGEPLAGIEGVDIWGGCPGQAPLNVRASVGLDGIMVSWNEVPGFDPANPNWFYQIELAQESGEGNNYGSNHIQQTSHLMPLAPFTPGAFGSPDGWNYGVGLSQLGDGIYDLVVYVFVPADEASGLITHECQVTAEDEFISLEISGGEFSIEP